MKLKILAIIAILFLFSPTLKSQTVQLGFRFEPAVVLHGNPDENEVGFSPYSLYLTALVEPVKWLKIDLRPGIFLGDSEYSGFEMGVFAKVKILPSKFFIAAGFNNHDNSNGGGSNSGGSYEKNMLFKVVGLGFQKDEKLSFDIMYHWTNDKEYGYSIHHPSYDELINNPGAVTKKIPKIINGIIKVGFSLAWDIF